MGAFDLFSACKLGGMQSTAFNGSSGAALRFHIIRPSQFRSALFMVHASVPVRLLQGTSAVTVTATTGTYLWAGAPHPLSIDTEENSYISVLGAGTTGGLLRITLISEVGSLTTDATSHRGPTDDSSTMGLWRDPEAVAGGYATLLDSGPNLQHMTEQGTTFITAGPARGLMARGTDGTTTNYLKSSTLGTDAAALVGNWTVQAWIWVHELSGTQTILQYAGGSPESLATNRLLDLAIDSSGKVGTSAAIWEYGSSGTNVTGISTSAGVVAKTWTHVAIVKDDDPANPGKKLITFYAGGSSIGSVSSKTNATGGTSSYWIFGREDGTTALFNGVARSVQVISRVATAAEIAANAARNSGDNAYTHVDASDTIVHYKCNEAPDTRDSSQCGMHLRVEGTVDSADPLIDDGGTSWDFNGTSYLEAGVVHPAAETYRQAGLNAWSFEAWVKAASGWDSARRGLMWFGYPSVTESLANNYYAVTLNTNRKFTVTTEHGSGDDSSLDMTAEAWSAAEALNLHHIAITFSSGTVKFYVDGVFKESGTVLAYEGGTAGRVLFGAGAYNNIMYYWLGQLDGVRWSNVVRTAAEILDTYQMGVG